MSKNSVFSGVESQKTFKSNLPNINFKEFEKVINTRRSVRVFKKDIIPIKVVKKCMENALKAPTSSNLQTWEIYWIRNKEKKNKVIKACLSQPAASTAKELFVFVSRPDLWKRNNQLMLNYFETRKHIPKSVYNYYTKITNFAYNHGFLGFLGFLKKILVDIIGIFKVIPREPSSFSDMKVWSQKTTALACQNFMLSMRAYGFDSCPMEGLDSTRMKKILELPKRAQICMAIGTGKRDDKGVYGNQLRFDNELFIKEV